MTPVVSVNRKSFEMVHPYVLPDGRRFASLFCAAHSALQYRGGQLLPVVDSSTGIAYDKYACQIEGHPDPIWRRRLQQ